MSLSFDDYSETLKQYSAEDYLTDGPYEALLEYVDRNPVLLRQFFRLLASDGIQKGVRPDELQERMMNCFAALDAPIETSDYIENYIEQLAKFLKPDGPAGLLPIMCGAGKSTAISQLIETTIERNDGKGLLILTDENDRLKGYLTPANESLRKALEAHADQITVMTAETLDLARVTAPKTPILLMSTQRYVNLTPEEIQKYLIWERGERPLIIIDEQYPTREVVMIDIDLLNNIDSMLDLALDPNTVDPEQKEWTRKQWARIKAYLVACADYYEKYQWKDGKERKSFFVWHEATKDALTEDDEKFIAFINQCRTKLNQYNFKGYRNIMAVWKLLKEGGAFSYSAVRGYYRKCFAAAMDNSDNLTKVNAVKVVLDGTGELSMMYKNPYFTEFDGSMFNRRLDSMTLHFVNINTGKGALLADTDNARLRQIAAFMFRQHPSREEIESMSFFSYKTRSERVLLEALKRKLNNEPEEEDKPETETTEEEMVGHFGGLKGKNIYRDKTIIAQVGLNLYSPLYYLAFVLEDMQEEKTQMNQMNVDQTEAILRETLSKTNSIEEIACNFILGDLEQNIFRGAIRDAACVEPYHYYVFIDVNSFQYLIDTAAKRYCALGAKIFLISETPDIIRVARTMRRQNAHGLSRAQKFLAWHDDTLQNDEEYTTAQIYQVMGIENKQQFKDVKKGTPVIKKCLQDECIGRGRYKKAGRITSPSIESERSDSSGIHRTGTSR